MQPALPDISNQMIQMKNEQQYPSRMEKNGFIIQGTAPTDPRTSQHFQSKRSLVLQNQQPLPRQQQQVLEEVPSHHHHSHSSISKPKNDMLVQNFQGNSESIQQQQPQVPQMTAAGLPRNQLKVKRFSRETAYESDQSLNETDQHFPQQPSSGETMDYKYKKSQSNNQQQSSSLSPATQLQFEPQIVNQEEVKQHDNQAFLINSNVFSAPHQTPEDIRYQVPLPQQQVQQKRVKRQQAPRGSHSQNPPSEPPSHNDNGYINNSQNMKQIDMTDRGMAVGSMSTGSFTLSHQNLQDPPQIIIAQRMIEPEINNYQEQQDAQRYNLSSRLQQVLNDPSHQQQQEQQFTDDQLQGTDSARFAQSSQMHSIVQPRRASLGDEGSFQGSPEPPRELSSSIAAPADYQRVDEEEQKQEWPLMTEDSQNFEQILAQQRSDPLTEGGGGSPAHFGNDPIAQQNEDVPSAPFETSEVQIEPQPQFKDSIEKLQHNNEHHHPNAKPNDESPQFSQRGSKQEDNAAVGHIEIVQEDTPRMNEEQEEVLKKSLESLQGLLSSDLSIEVEEFIAMIRDHKNLIRGLTNQSRPNFRKKRSDMVLRHMKFLQEQFAVHEERLALQLIIVRNHQLRKENTIIEATFLRMIPTKPSHPEWPRTQRSLVIKPLKLDVMLVPPQQINHEKQRYHIGDQGECTLLRAKSFREHEFKKLIGEAFSDANIKNQAGLRAKKLQQLVQGGLLECTGDQIFKAGVKLSKRAFSVCNQTLRKRHQVEIFSEIKLTKAAHIFIHVEDLFPKKYELNVPQNEVAINNIVNNHNRSHLAMQHRYPGSFNQNNGQGEFPWLSGENQLMQPVGGSVQYNGLTQPHRYDDNNSLNLEEIDGEGTRKNYNGTGRVILGKKKDSQGSRKVETPSNKRWSDSFQTRAAQFKNQQQKPRRSTHIPPIQSVTEQMHEMKIDAEGQESTPRALYERIINKEQIEHIERIIEQKLKFKEQAKIIFANQNDVTGASAGGGLQTKTSSKSKNRGHENTLGRMNVFKNNGAFLAVRSSIMPFYQTQDGFLGLSKADLEKILKEGVNDAELKVVKKVFIIPRDCDYAGVSDDILKRLINAMAASPQKNHSLQNSLQKSGEYKPSTFNSQRKRASVIKLQQSRSQVAIGQQSNSSSNLPDTQPMVVTDAALKELERIERKYLEQKKVYDVLNDEAIYDSRLYSEAESSKHKRLNENLPNPLIITIRKPQTQYEVDQNSFIIMDFLRDNYLNDFYKYSRHLTQNPRPTSRYYNTHHNRELAMLATGGFSKEHRALPKWRVQNNNELLNFQVAQLRRAYSLWLSRPSMNQGDQAEAGYGKRNGKFMIGNEDIRRTLFMSKNDLLMMKVKTAPNEYLCSPALVSRTIDKIIELCLRPEDIYKLTLIYKQGKRAPDRFGDVMSLDTQPHGENDSMIHVEQVVDNDSQQEFEVIHAVYLHNHPIFIPYNNDLDKNDTKINAFRPQSFRMSILFGYKSKMIKEGLYEVFEPVPDARYILSKGSAGAGGGGNSLLPGGAPASSAPRLSRLHSARHGSSSASRHHHNNLSQSVQQVGTKN